MSDIVKDILGNDDESKSKRAYYLMRLIDEPVLPQDVYTVNEVAKLLNISPDRVRSFGKRTLNPLPIRKFKNLAGRTARGSFVLRDELIEWLRNNTVSTVDIAKSRYED